MNRYYLALAELSRSVMSDSLPPHELYSLLGSSVHGDSPGKNTEMGCHALLQGIFPTQGLNPGLPQCRQILYHLSHQGSPPHPEPMAIAAEPSGASFSMRDVDAALGLPGGFLELQKLGTHPRLLKQNLILTGVPINSKAH